MNLKWLLFFFLIFIFVSISCKEDPPVIPPPPDEEKPTIEIFIDDYTCLEAWFRISISDTLNTNKITLGLNNIDINEFTLSGIDTSIFIDSLEINTEYTIKCKLFDGDLLIDSSETPFRTLDTTSGNFSWQVFNFGTHTLNYSLWRDVTIVNENDIWVVGETYMLDSSGNNDTQAYGAAHWNGTEWEILKVPFRKSPNQPNITPGDLLSVINFGPNAVYATAGYNLIKWNGSIWEEKVVMLIDQVYVTQMWGSDENNIYGCGPDGSVYRYSGNNWEKLPPVTDVQLVDIFGTPDGSKVWACGYSNDNTKSVLLEYEGNNGRIIWERVGNPTLGLQYASTVWAGKKIMYVAGGRAIYKKDVYSDSLIGLSGLNNWPYSIRGNGYNNIFTTGDRAMIWYYNGLAWRLLNGAISMLTLYSVDVKNNTVVAVGISDLQFPPRALIYFGTR